MSIEACYESVRAFNKFSGNLDGVGMASINLQLNLIDEELTETGQAAFDKNRVELLDGACDLFVTVAGLLQKLTAIGYDVEEALFRVTENNLDKFSYATYDESEIPEGCRQEFIKDYGGIFVLKDANNKIRKPLNFRKVELSDLVPVCVGMKL